MPCQFATACNVLTQFNIHVIFTIRKLFYCPFETDNPFFGNLSGLSGGRLAIKSLRRPDEELFYQKCPAFINRVYRGYNDLLKLKIKGLYDNLNFLFLIE